MRPSGRAFNTLRPISFARGFSCHAAGSVLVEFGDTRVLVTASVAEQVPRWMKGERKGLGDSRVWYVARIDAYSIRSGSDSW